LYKIEAFTRELKILGDKEGPEFVSLYAQTLLKDIEQVDLESLRYNLSKFGSILNEISQITDKTKD
jgi:hypothetical protein